MADRWASGAAAVLAAFAPRVISIGAEPRFHAAAQVRFRDTKNVEPICGLGETAFPPLMENIEGDVCFWLDGHYSGSTTFKADSDTPITLEFDAIKQNLSRLGRVCVLIDDVRCFDPDLPDFRDYPLWTILWTGREVLA